MRTTRLSTMAGAVALAVTAAPALAETDQERIDRLERQVEALADAVEGGSASAADSKLHIGGYGELHYNNLENDATGDEKEQLDFHRFVLMFGYDYTDDIRFFSELEVEHSLVGDGKPGEVELEQAYVEFDLNNDHRVKGGVFLIPVGILNETHEPPTFYGVERNQVEKEIIPTTWWAAGAMASGNLGDSGLSYDFGIHEGLANANADIRSGRQKSAKADASSLAYTGRLKYTGISGLELAGTIQLQDDLSQDTGGPAEDATLIETHAVWQSGPIQLKGLYAMWSVDGNGLTNVQEEQDGGYIEAAYKFDGGIGVFARQSTVSSFDGTDELDRDRTSVGLNYWPHEDVVVKFDIQQDDADNDADASDGFNVGIGYQF